LDDAHADRMPKPIAHTEPLPEIKAASPKGFLQRFTRSVKDKWHSLVGTRKRSSTAVAAPDKSPSSVMNSLLEEHLRFFEGKTLPPVIQKIHSYVLSSLVELLDASEWKDHRLNLTIQRVRDYFKDLILPDFDERWKLKRNWIRWLMRMLKTGAIHVFAFIVCTLRHNALNRGISYFTYPFERIPFYGIGLFVELFKHLYLGYDWYSCMKELKALKGL
jgi:hypothetical protein